MLIESISKYLLTNKRLVIPNLGAFIVKTPGEKILFSNMIKGDDGVLRRLLTEAGLSELKAAGLIDRFVFEVNYRLQNSGVCDINGLGRMVAGANGSISFEYNPSAQGDNLEGDMPALKAAEKMQKQNVESEVEKKSEKNDKQALSTISSSEQRQSVEQHHETQPIEPVSSSEPQLRRIPVRRIYGESAGSTRRVSAENYTKGLRYGKGHKVVTGRESATARRSNKGDVIIKIAILAAVVAILALAYGLYNDWRFGNLEKKTSSVIENRDIYEEVPKSAEKGVRNPDLDYITPKE